MPKKRRKFEKKVTVPRIIHKPTFCILQAIDYETGKLPIYERHHLSPFSEKSDVQSNHSANRFKEALNWLFMFAEKKNVYSKKAFTDKHGQERHNFSFRLAMITLTISAAQTHTDEFIKEHMLQPFLLWLWRKSKANYVWKAETQLNGNIHFHITIDSFIHWEGVALKWMHLLNNNGYPIRKFPNGAFDSRHDASTQVKAIRNEEGFAKICGGYLTKNSIEEKHHNELKTAREEKLKELIEKTYSVSQSLKFSDINIAGTTVKERLHYTRFVSGRLWGCSESLSKIQYKVDALAPNDEAFISTYQTFFHANKLQRLSTVMANEHRKKNPMQPEEIAYEYEAKIHRTYWQFRNVFIHRHLKYCKLPQPIQKELSTIKANYKVVSKKNYTVESLF